MLTRSSVLLCPPGYYCRAGLRRPCPPGTYGATSGLTGPDCSGRCAAGHYCPLGSMRATEFKCPAGRYGAINGLFTRYVMLVVSHTIAVCHTYRYFLDLPTPSLTMDLSYFYCCMYIPCSEARVRVAVCRVTTVRREVRQPHRLVTYVNMWSIVGYFASVVLLAH